MKIKTKYKKWKETVLKKTLDKVPERKKSFKNSWGKEIDRVSLPKKRDYLEDLGFPGQFPYTRGIQPTMYRARLWTMRQYAGFGTSKDTNKRFKYLLKKGQNGLSVAFDLPTQIGLDSDDPLAQGEVGRIGVAVDSLADFEEIFSGIKLDNISTSMTINSTAIILLAMYIALGEVQGVKKENLSGTVQNDILKEYTARGTYIFPIDKSMKLVTDIIEYCTKYVPKFNSISISGYHIREAGSNALQELAFTIADGTAYIDAALKRGLDIDDFAPRLSFFFSAQMNFLEEVAKFRAARRIWARLLKEKYKAKNPKSLLFRFHTQTAGSSLITNYPLNNITRTAIEALSAVLGGTQSLHTNSFDEALAIPSKEAVDVALKTQQIIAHETDFASTIDPLAGSYYIEDLTDKFEEATLDELKKIKKHGGMVKAIQKGYIKKQIEDNAYKKYKRIADKENIIVGFNEFKDSKKQSKKLELEKHNTQKEQLKKLSALKKRRNNHKVEKNLTTLEKILKDRNQNTMEAMIECVKSYATIGEITKVMKNVYGEYQCN